MLTVVVPTFNNVDSIGRVLQSARTLTDRLVVVDSFSTDDTTRRAAEMGARVFQREYGYSASQKNWILDRVETEWVLILDSDEVLYYVDGDFMSRKSVERGQITLHPGGIPHGPHLGTVEKSIGKKETHELAVMVDTFRPLKMTEHAVAIEDNEYYHSWLPNAHHGNGAKAR